MPEERREFIDGDWVMSPEAKVVWVYTPGKLEGEVYGKGDLEPITIPGLKINIPSLFQ